MKKNLFKIILAIFLLSSYCPIIFGGIHADMPTKIQQENSYDKASIDDNANKIDCCHSNISHKIIVVHQKDSEPESSNKYFSKNFLEPIGAVKINHIEQKPSHLKNSINVSKLIGSTILKE